MSFSLTATPEPSNSPPRVLLEATESDSAKPIQSCQFFRDGVALRFSATVAGDTAVAYDYDAPFDVSLEYRADAVEADTLVLDWTETWASLAAWTSLVAGWSVAAGKATTSTSNSSIWRAASAEIARVTGPAPTVTNGNITVTGSSLVDGSLSAFQLNFDSTGPSISLTTSAGVDFATHAFTDWTLDVSDTAVSVVGTGWSLTVPIGSGPPAERVFLSFGTSGGGSTSIDDISVYKFADPPTAEVTDTDTTSLTGITAAWLTNAAAPDSALAIDDCSDADPDYYLTEETGRTTVSRSSSVALDIEGSADVRTVVTGPRKNKTSTLEVAVKNFDALDALDAVLANNAAVNLRFPATMSDLGIKDGFYDVGDVTETRVEATPRIRQQTVVQMPLTPSSGVSFDVLWQWNWDALAQTGMTWDQAAAVFATWTDLLIGPTT